MKCINCGAEIPDHAELCTNCGTAQEFDRTLIDRAKNGDTQAETRLYNATYNNVYALIKSMVKDEDTVLDLLQDSYVKAFRSLGQLQEANKFRPWLKTIARNRTMDYFRERKTLLFSEMTPLDGEDTAVEFEDTNPEAMPDVVIDRQETARLLSGILDTLPEDQRGVISMFYYEQMSVKEIAAALELNENTVLSRLNYGRKKVKAQVLDLEKRGTRIYGLAPIPFLLLLLRKNEAYAMEPGRAASSLARILQQTGQSAGAAAQEAAAQAAQSAAKEAAQSGASSAAQAAGQAAAGTAQGVAAAAAVTAAKAGIPLAAKIIAAAAAVGVVGIGAAVVIPAVRGNDTPQTEIVAEAPAAVTATEAAATEDGETASLVTQESETGISDGGADTGAGSDTQVETDEPVLLTNGMTQEEVYASYSAIVRELEETYGALSIAQRPAEEGYGMGDISYTQGVSFLQLTDFDADGSDELVVIYREEADLTLAIYGVQDEEVKKILEDPGLEFTEYIWGEGWKAYNVDLCFVEYEGRPCITVEKTGERIYIDRAYLFDDGEMKKCLGGTFYGEDGAEDEHYTEWFTGLGYAETEKSIAIGGEMGVGNEYYSEEEKLRAEISTVKQALGMEE